MPRFSPALLSAALAVLLTPVVAAAGPIGWSYSADYGMFDGIPGEYAWFGTLDKVTTDPGTHTPYFVIGRVPQWDTRGTGSGTATVRAGTFLPGDLESTPTNDPWANSLPQGFRLTVTLTDAASSLSQSLSYFVFGTASGSFTPESQSLSLVMSVDQRTDAFVLGGTRYTVTPVVVPDGSGSDIDLRVTAGPAAATPEPGTLALAGFGLAACGAGWARRRAGAARPAD